jgi:hypothetical protein
VKIGNSLVAGPAWCFQIIFREETLQSDEKSPVSQQKWRTKRIAEVRTFRYKIASSECSAVWLAHLVWDQRVVGSNPITPTTQKPCFSPEKQGFFRFRAYLFKESVPKMSGCPRQSFSPLLDKPEDVDSFSAPLRAAMDWLLYCTGDILSPFNQFEGNRVDGMSL